MTSWRQLEANRRNSRSSTGPRTEQGKQRSRQNALRHGLTAETVVDVLEDPAAYRAFETQVLSDYLPTSTIEREFVTRLASPRSSGACVAQPRSRRGFCKSTPKSSRPSVAPGIPNRPCRGCRYHLFGVCVFVAPMKTGTGLTHLQHRSAGPLPEPPLRIGPVAPEHSGQARAMLPAPFKFRQRPLRADRPLRDGSVATGRADLVDPPSNSKTSISSFNERGRAIGFGS